MTQEEIIEGNKIIGEFVGLEITSIKSNEYQYATRKLSPWRVATIKLGKTQEDYTNSANFWTFDIKFHSSWDWIIPVLKKCHQEELNKGWHKIDCLSHTLEIKDLLSDDAIFYIWKEVIEFIKWYNETNNNTNSI
jgi:hypothetical protein